MKIDDALIIAKNTRAKLLAEKISLLAALQNCKTICRYLDRLDNNEWIDYELHGYPDSLSGTENGNHELPIYRIVYQVFFDECGREVSVRNSELAHTLGKIRLGNSIAEILQYKTSGMKLPSSPGLEVLNSQEFKSDYDIPSNAPCVLYGRISSGQIAKIIMAVQDKTYEFLDNIILELEYGSIPERIFETIRKEIDEKFMDRCPDAIKKLIFIYEELKTNNNVVYSQIASTCRQIIKDVADSLYPPEPQSNKNDNGIKLTEDKYLNRLTTAISSNTERKTFRAMAEYTIRFLHAINDYASKGDHGTFQKSDAVRCVVYTYILLGDILHYHTSNNMSTK